MSLKNKDGTEYTLRRPNPIMKTQETWSDFKVHNLKNLGVKVIDENAPPPASEMIVVEPSFVEELQATKEVVVKQEPTKPEPVKPEPMPEPQVSKVATQLPSEIKINIMHCRPATIRERKDSIYGEPYRTIQYGQNFELESVITKEEDLIMQLWTKVKLTKGSILYPKIGAKRWWRVQEITEKTGGWLITSVPSSEQPAFN